MAVSIHAPTRGATLKQTMEEVEKLVSIHAPTRGATHMIFSSALIRMFQSTHPHGVRLCLFAFCCSCGTFQSTHPHGVRLICYPCIASSHGFNPRTHTGCDNSSSPISTVNGVSIHAPTRGATSISSFPAIYQQGFNPRTHTGCDSRNIDCWN